MHRSAANIRFRSGFVFLLCFWKCGFSKFKCTVFVKLGRAILDKVCSVHEILPLWLRIDQWTVKYNFLYVKIKLDRILWHYGSIHFGCFIQNPVQDTWASVLSELFRIESTVYFSQNLLVMITNWSVNCQVQFSVRENQTGSNSVTLWLSISVVSSKIQCKTLEHLCSPSCLQ